MLVTASHRQFADQIAAHLGLFDAALAPDGDRNLAGPHKTETLVERQQSQPRPLPYISY